METIAAFVGLPVVFLLSASGLGLLVERITRAELPNTLLVPVGFCTAVSLLLTVYKVGGQVEAAVATLLVGGLGGFALTRSQLRRVLDLGPIGLAAAGVYVLYLLPVLATGAWTWLGYNFVNDTAVQFLLAEHLKAAGSGTGGLPDTSGGQAITTYLGGGYPIGTHAYAATLSGVLGQPIEIVYQPFLACMAAVTALALAVVARTVVGARVAGVLAFAALASNLTLQYAFQGNIKEIGVLAAVCAAAAVAVQIVRVVSPPALAAVLGLCLAAVLGTFNAAGGPYVLAIAASLVATLLVVRGREVLCRAWLLSLALVVGVSTVASLAALTTIATFYSVASGVVGSSVAGRGGSIQEFGVLSHRMPLTQASGIWLDGRYFEPIEPDTLRDALTTAGAVIVIALLLCALVVGYRRRRPEALLAVGPVALTAAFVAPGVSPYADGKLLAILSPAVVLTAGIGLVLVWERARPAALAVGAGLLALIAVSDGFAYHDVKYAPRERMEAIGDAVDHAPGRGLILYTEAEEFAKYFDGPDRLNPDAEPITPRPVKLRDGKQRILGNFYDLDQQTLAYVQSFGQIITRRGPSASRPPASFRTVYENRFYTVWSRAARSPTVLHHIPAGLGATSATGRPACAAIGRAVTAARRAGRRVHAVGWSPPATVRFDVAGARSRSSGLPVNGNVANAVTVPGPGRAQGRVTIPEAGAYAVWLRADVLREIDVAIDGRRIGDVSGVNTPGQWLPVRSVRLGAGAHEIRVSATGRSPKPGVGWLGLLGPVALVRAERGSMQRVPLSRAQELCGQELDWVEIVADR